MSEEYSDLGTVRRRPRMSHHRPGSAGNGNGRYGRGGAASIEEEEWYQRRSSEPRRAPRSRREERRSATEFDSDDVEPGFRLPFDPMRLLAAAKRNLVWIIVGTGLAAIAGFFLAAMTVDYKVTMGLMRKTSNAMRNEGVQLIDKFTVREYSDQTIFSFMKSREVLANVAAKASTNVAFAGLNITPQELARVVTIRPADNPDFVMLSLNAFGPLRQMVDLVNLYSDEVVAYTRKVQRSEAMVIREYLENQLAHANDIITNLTLETRQFAQTGLGHDRETEFQMEQLTSMKQDLITSRVRLNTLDAQIAILKGDAGQGVGNVRLQQAQAELAEMRVKYTDEHPEVIAKLKEIERLRNQTNWVATAAAMPRIGTDSLSLRLIELQSERGALQREVQQLESEIGSVEKTLKGNANIDVNFALKNAELQSQKAARDSLQSRLREAELYINNALGYFQVVEPASMNSVNHKARWAKVTLLSILAGMLGLVASVGLVMLTEALDTSLKTTEDIVRAAGLPVLASLGDLKTMSSSAQANWAFRTLTILKGKLSRNSDQALVCGIISANHGEGRSTWVNLLTAAASQRGLRVLTVDTRAASPASATKEAARESTAKPADTAEAAPAEERKATINLPEHMDSPLATPARVNEHFEQPDSQAVVHIPLPGWVWSLERRKQWQDALDQWRDIENLVIFVELPPACEQESLLLAENVPHLIWLVGSGMADAAETKAHLETVQHARCNLVGAVLNYAPPPIFNSRLARWFQRMNWVIALAATMLVTQAQENPAPTQQQGNTNPELRPATVAAPDDRPALSATARRKRAAWQERLTFGPGDTIDIHVFGRPGLSRTNVVVGPDGRINFLQASGVTASGLTVEELRDRLDRELARFYTEAAAPRTIVVPVAFSSKKYFILGMVNNKGAFVLDRPLTLVEAVARAKGFETGLYQRNTVEMADFSHSFLIRDGEKLPVDFEKLFQEGDLSHNVMIEPNDYIYFASTGANEIYVFGEVMNPGPIGFVPNATVLTAITDRGGYSDRAFKRRVLVVRGSLNEPETFVVDSGGSLDARIPDFRLQPRDIVYVSSRPWVRAEELLDEAAASFIQGAITTWAGVNVGPVITKRVFPRTRPR